MMLECIENEGTGAEVNKICNFGSVIMKFNKSIQGSKTVTSVFTRAIEITLAGLAEAASHFVDDLLVHSQTDEQHFADLEKVFARILDSNLKLIPAKANFLSAKITYLGFTSQSHFNARAVNK